MVKVSVICISFNQSSFIDRALNSFVMQKTDFPFEVIVHDDASTDGTQDIIREYQQKYPDIIKPVLETENQFSQNKDVVTSKSVLSQIHGKYVALCEGDDYWTDENKLQIQADFLDAHSDFSICFHPVKVLWENNMQKPSVFPQPVHRRNKTVLELQDLLKNNFIQTNSVMYRWRDPAGLWPGFILPGDWFLHLLHAQVGKIGFIDRTMAVYFRNSGGIWATHQPDSFYLKNGIPLLRCYEAIERQFNADKTGEKSETARKIAESALKNNRLDILTELLNQFGKTVQTAFSEECCLKYKKKLKTARRWIRFLTVCIVFLFLREILK